MVPTEVTDPPHQVIFFTPGGRLLTVTAHVPHHKCISILCIDFLICSGQTAVPLMPGWLCSASLTPQTRNFAHPGKLHTQGWAKVQHLGHTVLDIWTLMLKCHHSGNQSYTIIENKPWLPDSELTSTRAHPATSLPFPDSSSWQEVSTAGVKKRMWAEHLPHAANQHLAPNINCLEGTPPGLQTVLCEAWTCLTHRLLLRNSMSRIWKKFEVVYWKVFLGDTLENAAFVYYLS